MKSSVISFSLVCLGLSACNLINDINEKESPQVSEIYTTAESFMVNPGDTTKFWVEATDPQKESLSYIWTLAVGEIIGSTQRDTLHWKAPLSGGKFKVSIKVSNSEKSVTKSKDVTVITFNRPYVKIVKPSVNEFLVQYQPATIKVQAIHYLGIADVYLWINDTFVISQPGIDGEELYEFDWDGNASAGITEIKVSAISKITALTGVDSTDVPVEGIVRGKR